MNTQLLPHTHPQPVSSWTTTLALILRVAMGYLLGYLVARRVPLLSLITPVWCLRVGSVLHPGTAEELRSSWTIR